MFTELFVPLATQAGITGAVIWALVVLHRSAVRAHRERADDWRIAAQTATDRADERDRQLWAVLSAVKEKAVS
jgi:hypothetical protein